jgi:hypothetical protein
MGDTAQIGDPLRCSFCGKLQTQVRKLIAGQAALICNECLDVCNEIVQAEREERDAPLELPEAAPARELRTSIATCRLCGLPVVREEALGLGARGFLCTGCVEAVEESLAQSRQPPIADL